VILNLLTEEPMHGYQVMQELETRSGGRWRPSAGSVYPTLQQLQDERLVSVEEIDGRRTYRLTEAGRTAASTQPGPMGDGAWTGGRGRSGDLHGLTREVRIAAMQVARAGSPPAIDAAGAILSAARRDLYRLLADEPLETAVSGETAADVEEDTAAG
jgi:Transcriptional regulator PadR-like family